MIAALDLIRQQDLVERQFPGELGSTIIIVDLAIGQPTIVSLVGGLRMQRRVAVLVETSKAFGRGILRGVRRYIQSHSSWAIWIEERGLDDPPGPWLREWDGDGIITRTSDEAFARAILEKSVPVVHVRQSLPEIELPRVYVDDAAVGRMAARHLLDRGFRHFAFVGRTDREWTQIRGQAFSDLVQCAGCDCDVAPVLTEGWSADWKAEHQLLTDWLSQLKIPCGLMASHDSVGLKVLNACRVAKIAVPERLAVVAADNDELICDLADPPMSSIKIDFEAMGFQAASMLDALISGASVPTTPVLSQPLGVEIRQSTDVAAIDDPHVAAACEFIRLHATENISVETVARHIKISRRAMERKFIQVLHRTPQSEIRRIRLARAAILLEETDDKLRVIAKLCGFRHHEYLSKLFREQTGVSPGRYRAAVRHQRGAANLRGKQPPS